MLPVRLTRFDRVTIAVWLHDCTRVPKHRGPLCVLWKLKSEREAVVGVFEVGWQEQRL
jgi:hypothetical protein